MREMNSMRNSCTKSLYTVLAITLLSVSSALGQTAAPSSAVLHGYRKARERIPQILRGRPTPLAVVSPNADMMLLGDRLTYPPIADLAQPMLRLAGVRINQATNGRHHPPRVVGLHLVSVADGKQRNVELPRNAYVGGLQWSPDGQRFAFTDTTENGIELWVGQAATATAHSISGVKISTIIGDPLQWMPDGHTLLVQAVPAKRGNPPVESKVPDGPIIQESDGKKAPAATFEDLLQNAHDEDLFDYYTTAQLLLVDTT